MLSPEVLFCFFLYRMKCAANFAQSAESDCGSLLLAMLAPNSAFDPARIAAVDLPRRERHAIIPARSDGPGMLIRQGGRSLMSRLPMAIASTVVVLAALGVAHLVVFRGSSSEAEAAPPSAIFEGATESAKACAESGQAEVRKTE